MSFSGTTLIHGFITYYVITASIIRNVINIICGSYRLTKTHGARWIC